MRTPAEFIKHELRQERSETEILIVASVIRGGKWYDEVKRLLTEAVGDELLDPGEPLLAAEEERQEGDDTTPPDLDERALERARQAAWEDD
jgi:hypothetical protein